MQVSCAATVAQGLAAEGLTFNPFLRRGRTHGVLSRPNMGSESMTSSARRDLRARSGDVMTMYPAGRTIPAMLERLAALPRPRAIERRDDEPLPERPAL